jgi:3-phenylpropionate/trans-cinnamate dioxygenase ferredoxin subunit
MADYVVVGNADEVPEGTVREYVVGDTEVAVARSEGELYAFSAICSHAYARLAEGEVDTDFCVIECPMHGARFDMSSGRVRALPATEPIQTYNVREVEGQIAVAIDA